MEELTQFQEQYNLLKNNVLKDTLSKMYEFSYPSKIIYFDELKTIHKDFLNEGITLIISRLINNVHFTNNEIFGFIGRGDSYELILSLTPQRKDQIKSLDSCSKYNLNYINWDFSSKNLYTYNIDQNKKNNVYISIPSKSFCVLNPSSLYFYIELNTVISKYINYHNERYIYHYDTLIKGDKYHIKIDCPNFKKQYFQDGLPNDFFIDEKIIKYFLDFKNDENRKTMYLEFENSKIYFSK